jgi:3-phenylpropionate/trans-cinnamate dioxygenase ferredoxin reductase component
LPVGDWFGPSDVAMTQPDTTAHVVIVGAGHAGGSAATLLRQFGWKGAITLVGEEPFLPYQRPPLSKTWLKEGADAASVALRPAGVYHNNNIRLLLGVTATSIDRDRRAVALSTGETLPYDELIVATGARPRVLPVPGRELGGVLDLRGIADADRIKAALVAGSRFVVIGGGYIGLEVAASARTIGASVAVVEREERVLARIASPILSSFFHQAHEAQDVQILCNATVAAIEGSTGRATFVCLGDGARLPCDAVLVGIGAGPDERLARDAGIACEGGIVVDLAARTSDPHIHAIGDCTWRPLPLYDRRFRLESVPNALEQAKQATADLCGRPPPAPEVPWFWSDQYDIRLQIAGLPFDAACTIVRGDPASGRFAVFHLALDGTLQAVEAVNAPTEFMAGKSMIGRRKKVMPDRLRDVSVSMQELASGTGGGI